MPPPLAVALPSPATHSPPTFTTAAEKLPRCRRRTRISAFKPEPDSSSQSFRPNSPYHLFDETPQRNNAPLFAQAIASHARAHQWAPVLSTFVSMLAHGARPDKFLIPKILKACSELTNLSAGAAVHGYMVRIQLRPDTFVANSLIDMYAKCGDIVSCRAVFDRMGERDVVSWTALLNAYSEAGLLSEAVGFFGLMSESGVRPDLICWNALVSGLARNGEIEEAVRFWEEMRGIGINPGVNSWNGLISGCMQNGFFEDALDVFAEMCLKDKLNSVTVASILPACAGLGALSLGKEIHSYVIRSGIKMNVYVGGALIDMYLKCGMKTYAEQVFSELEMKSLTIWNEMIASYVEEDKMSDALALLESMKDDGFKPDVVSYNTILAGYARKGQKEEAFRLLAEMGQVGVKPNVISMNAVISGFHHSGLHNDAIDLFRVMKFSQPVSVQPNAVSLTSAVSLCTELKLLLSGKEIHCYVLKHHFESNIFVSSALVDMYATCRDMLSATKTFRLIGDKNVVSWNVLMSGFNHNGDPQAALKLFSEMLEENLVIPNSITLLILLLACSNTTALRLGRGLHGYIVKQRPDGCPLTLTSSLIAMYSKCGSIVESRSVFDSTHEKDIAIWNAMISSYSLHGMAKNAISLFEEMLLSGVEPDHVTFTSILAACNQEGFVDKGWEYFNKMEDVYGVTPSLEHFTCMVDILGTAGLLEESMDFIRRMPFEPDACLWATLLKACKLHSNYEVGEKAARALFELEPGNALNYISLSNIFAMAGKWDSSMNLRNSMRAHGIKTVNSCSWICMGSTIHSFRAGDVSHPEMEKILDKWDELANEMVQIGYTPQNVIFCDEGSASPFCCYHTEKLAVCFGLISLPMQSPIRISKNVRMCMDCHSSAKLISKIVKREIFLTDGCFYHHFRDGMCSCRDRW